MAKKPATKAKSKKPRKGSGTDAAKGTVKAPAADSPKQTPRPPAKKARRRGARIRMAGMIAVPAVIIAWFVLNYVHYSFKTTEQARQYYLEENASPSERIAYQTLEPCFREPPASLDDLKRALSIANLFLKNYPESLFSIPPNAINYAGVYRTPWGLRVFARNIPRTADSLAGIVRRERAVLRETYQCHLRAARHQTEEAEIKLNEAESKFNLTKARVLADLAGYADQVLTEYRDKAGALDQLVKANRQTFETEKRRLHQQLLAQTTKLRFKEALDIFEIAWKHPRGYRVLASDTLRDLPLNTLELKLHEFKRCFAGQTRSMGIGDLKKLFYKHLEGKGLKAVRRALFEGPARNREIFDDRNEWFDMSETTLQKAKQYNALVAGTKTRFKGVRIETQLKTGGFEWRELKQESGDRIEIVNLHRYELEARLLRYDKKMYIQVVGTEKIPLSLIIRLGIFHELAARAWAEKDAAELKLSQGCHEFYFRPLKSRKLLRALRHDRTASFLLRELGLSAPDQIPE